MCDLIVVASTAERFVKYALIAASQYIQPRIYSSTGRKKRCGAIGWGDLAENHVDLQMGDMASGLVVEAAVAFHGRIEGRDVVVGRVDGDARAGVAGDVPQGGGLQPPSPQDGVDRLYCAGVDKQSV